MTINLQMPDIRELKPRITVFGVGGAGCNAVNNMIDAGLEGVDFVVANTDAQALTMSKADRLVQMGVAVTEGLGAGSQPEIGRAAAEETIDEINDHLSGSHMVFITAGMGGGTGTGAAPVVAKAAREAGILTVGVVTKPFQFEGQRRMRIADGGIEDLQKHVDTLIVIPNQNLFRIANEKTTFADAFAMADEVLYSGVACITDLMVKDGLINLDFADVRSVMREMGKAMMGTGEAGGDKRAVEAAEAAISNPLLDEVSMRGARGLLISVTGGKDMTLFEVDEAASRVREEVDDDASIIFGATFDERLEGTIRVSVVSTGIDCSEASRPGRTTEDRMAELTKRLRNVAAPARNLEQPAANIPAPSPVESQQAATAARVESLERELEIPQGQVLNRPVAPEVAPPAPQTAAELAAARPVEKTRVETGSDIKVERFRPEPSLIATGGPVAKPAMREAPAAAAEHRPERFVPPAPAQADEVSPKMPRVEDFPPVAQRQMQESEAVGDENRPRGLLARIAQNLAKREDGEGIAENGRAQSRQAEPTLAPIPAAPVAVEQAPQAPKSDFAKQRPPQPRRAGEAPPAAGNLDPRGRPQSPGNIQDEGELEIPAFLRRQSN